MAKSIQRVASVFLSLVFIVGGAMKFPIIKSMYESERERMELYVTAFPGMIFGSPVDAVTYMYVAGTYECTLGIGLLLGSRKTKMFCAGGLAGIMVIGLYTVVKLGHYAFCPLHICLLSSLCWTTYSYFGQDGQVKKTE